MRPSPPTYACPAGKHHWPRVVCAVPLLPVRQSCHGFTQYVLAGRTRMVPDDALHAEADVDGVPELLAVLAVVTEYKDVWLRNALRAEWYTDGDAASLERRIGVRAVFLIGRNPVSASDGSGRTTDAEDVAAEVAQWGDVLRVSAEHSEGNEGKAELVHDLWRALPARHHAQFYVKAQVRRFYLLRVRSNSCQLARGTRDSSRQCRATRCQVRPASGRRSGRTSSHRRTAATSAA